MDALFAGVAGAIEGFELVGCFDDGGGAVSCAATVGYGLF